MASARVEASLRKRPRTAEVTVVVPGFLTPRIDMHRCSASTTTNTPWGSERFLDGIGDLGGHALLDLEAFGEAVHQTGQFGETGDATVVAGNVGHVGPSDEGDHVVLAQRGERYVPHHHHFVVFGGEGDLEMVGRVLAQPGEQLHVAPGHPFRRPE